MVSVRQTEPGVDEGAVERAGERERETEREKDCAGNETKDRQTRTLRQSAIDSRLGNKVS